MKLLTSSVFAILLTELVLAQGKTEVRLDSMNSLARKQKTSEKVHVYHSAAEFYLFKDTLGIHFTDSAIVLAEREKEYDDLSDLYKLKADYNNFMGDDREAIHNLKLSVYFGQKGAMSDSIRLERYVGVSNYFARIFEYDSAIKYGAKTVEIAEANNVISPRIYINLAYINNGMKGDPKISLGYCETAIELAEELSIEAKRHNLYYAHGNKALAYYELEDWDSYLTSSLEQLKYASNYNDTLYAWANLAHVYPITGNVERSLYYLTRTIQGYENSGNVRELAKSKISLSDICLKQGRVEFASRVLNEGMALIDTLKDRETYSLALLTLHKIQKRQGDFDHALSTFTKYLGIRDSLYRVKNAEEYEALQSTLNFKLTSSENRLLRQESEFRASKIENQRQLLLSFTIILGIILVTLAITVIGYRSRKRLVRLLNNRNEKLSKANGLIRKQHTKLKSLDEAKSRFFSNISHDLRSPLTLILNAFDEIKENDFRLLEKESRVALEVGARNGKRLLHLAEEIMELTRLEEGKIKLKPKFVAIGPYTKMLTKMLYSAADAKLITLNFKDELPADTSIWLDPMHYEKILYNLISNATKFTPNDGNIEVKLQLQFDHLSLSVTDTGSGIPRESIDHIFDRYYQSRANKTTAHVGVGIGLALVKELVDLHEGLIEVRSSDEGSCFQVSFPFKTKKNTVAPPIVPESSLDISSRESLWSDLYQVGERIQVPSLSNPNTEIPTILIVEDHKEIREYLRHILKDEYRVCEAQDGRAALEVVKRRKIDLIISDLMMPSMDGFALVSELKTDKNHSKIPVLVLSARAVPSEKLDLLEKGADAILYKPCEKRELLAQTANLLARRSKWDADLQLEKLYQSVDDHEKTMLSKLESLIVNRIDDQNLSVNDLAEEMAASESKMYRFVKNKTGLSPLEYIKEIRLQYVRKYLENNQVRSLIEAAKKIGMNNATYFKQQYIKRFGRPPQTMTG